MSDVIAAGVGFFVVMITDEGYFKEPIVGWKIEYSSPNEPCGVTPILIDGPTINVQGILYPDGRVNYSEATYDNVDDFVRKAKQEISERKHSLRVV